MEIEAKFDVADEAMFERLCALQSMEGWTLTPTGAETHIDRYFDARDRRVERAGFACRERHIERGASSQRLLTLKSLGAAVGDVHLRREIELALDELIDLSAPLTWPTGEAFALLRELTQDAPLVERFVLSQTRHKRRTVRDAHGTLAVELSLDHVALPSGTHFFELEAELLPGGAEADLLDFIAALRRQMPLVPQPLSKFTRAIQLT